MFVMGAPESLRYKSSRTVKAFSPVVTAIGENICRKRRVLLWGFFVRSTESLLLTCPEVPCQAIGQRMRSGNKVKRREKKSTKINYRLDRSVMNASRVCNCERVVSHTHRCVWDMVCGQKQTKWDASASLKTYMLLLLNFCYLRAVAFRLYACNLCKCCLDFSSCQLVWQDGFVGGVFHRRACGRLSDAVSRVTVLSVILQGLPGMPIVTCQNARYIAMQRVWPLPGVPGVPGPDISKQEAQMAGD